MKKLILITIFTITIVMSWALVINDMNYIDIKPGDKVPDYVAAHSENYYINPETGDIRSEGDKHMHIFIALVVTMGCIIGMSSILTYLKD